jgi:hypothetical protein
MSYDLYFRSQRPPTVDAIKAYFREQPRFVIHDRRAGYENEDTGVYFGFDFTDEHKPGDAPVAFNINYYRSHVFGLEAEPVLTAFIAEFELGIHDPQSQGMGDGPYSPEGFLRGWNAGNRFGYRAIVGHAEATPPFMLPQARVEGMWRWNYGKDQASEHMLDLIGEAPPCFVPTVMPIQTGETEVKTLVIWDAQMAIAIPDVDLVLTLDDAGEAIVVPTSDALGIVEVHSTWDENHDVGGGFRTGLRAWLVDELSPATSQKLRDACRPFQPIGRLSPDQVLDAELYAEALASKRQ